MSRARRGRDLRRPDLAPLLARWIPRLGLETWAIQWRWDSGMSDLATCQAEAEYATAELLFHPALARHPREAIEEVVLHELCHCLTARLAGLALEQASVNELAGAEEDLVSRLTRLFLRAYR
jgi:hypothetical protein